MPKDKIFQLVEISIQQNGRYPRYSHELFLGTPKWIHHLDSMILNEGKFRALNRQASDLGCGKSSLDFLEVWYQTKSDQRLTGLLLKLGYIDKNGYLKRNKTSVSKKHQKLILDEVSLILNEIFTTQSL